MVFLEFLAAENLKQRFPPLLRYVGVVIGVIVIVILMVMVIVILIVFVIIIIIAAASGSADSERESRFWGFLADENLKNTIPIELPPIASGNGVCGVFSCRENLKNAIPAPSAVGRRRSNSNSNSKSSRKSKSNSNSNCTDST